MFSLHLGLGNTFTNPWTMWPVESTFCPDAILVGDDKTAENSLVIIVGQHRRCGNDDSEFTTNP